MTHPTLVEVLRRLGWPVPDGAWAVTIDNEERPTWVEFSINPGAAGGQRTRHRMPLTPEQQALLLQALQVFRVGYVVSTAAGN